jgi:aryl-alcohol dehydrogenase-like predicted oxidoreductase
MTLAIGTASWGKPYGIRGRQARDIPAILSKAQELGIHMIDTAPAYNVNADFTGFDVVTKTPWDGKECYAVLVHTPDNLSELPSLLGKVRAGVSVYTIEQLTRAMMYDIDIVQIPLSIVDGRFLPYLPRLRERGIEIHARSVFLQGALLMQNPPVDVPTLDVATCLGYVLNQDIDFAVVGVDSAEQLEELARVKPLDIENYCLSEERVNPTLWRG